MTQHNRWVRSWLPEKHPLLASDRPRVVDYIERFPIDNYNYRPLIEDHMNRFPGTGLIHVDWDTAFGIETRDAFEHAARASADRILVAPVRIYPDSTALSATVWNHRVPEHVVGPSRTIDVPGMDPVSTRDSHMAWRWVNENDPECALFGFGMIYIPYDICLEFLQSTALVGVRPDQVDEKAYVFNDYAFSNWYYRKHGLTRITWDIIPVHIHWQSAFEG